MIEVFRIEHKESRIGPFQQEKIDRFIAYMIRKAGRQRHLKAPIEDGIYLSHLPWTYVFGAPSIPKLKEWVFFGRRRDDNRRIVKALKKRDFTLAEYLVADGDYMPGQSGNQLLFCPDTSREEGLVQYHDLTVLLNESPLVFDVN